MLKVTAQTMESWDGTTLFYRTWQPDQKAEKVIILFHRGHEHSARWQDVIEQLDLPGFAFYAWDARGHGRSPGERGYADSFGCLVKDVDAFVRHVSIEQGVPYQNIVVLAHSVGSVLVSTWVHDYAPPIRGLVLGSPALRVRLYIPFSIPVLRLASKLKDKMFISSYVKGSLLTHSPEKQRAYDMDPLITPNIAVNILLGLYDAGTRLMRDAGAITLPTLILTSGADFVVKQSAQRRFYNGLRNPRKEMQTFPGFFHDTFNEKDSHLPIAKAQMFITDLFFRPMEHHDLLDADLRGYTKEEFDRLRAPLPTLAPKRYLFAITSMLMKSAGKLSRGIQIGLENGFDSGSMLDYVYQNEAQGVTPIGRLIDRIYLNSPGWRGIRQRKTNLEKLLKWTIEQLLSTETEVRIADIATGQGRYVLDVLKAYTDNPVSALLRDHSDINIDAGRQIAREMGLEHVVFEQGDAFDGEAVAALPNQPNIGIVSGLYELFPDNGPIRASLNGLSQAIAAGGYLIYTNQPWHPQLEFIARVLTSHRDGAPWVMRRRTQQEMDQLVANAGFKKLAMEIDEDGIFSVSIARRIMKS
ncbi:MAG: bifunctional alpha/beta hydrolase/class I SAM-dependent methyltransferase [Candidatus Thiodiazotropha sp. (ex Myrtea sp. 'scaly one' KF741663)]|nr:bifunctional alpha/beta hydrolase/class I SAM-dependent methyltransferase [Candidatus Thiodiazotropha sp. (ex Myrtea sp. 'scaly one' KF741663)]